MRLLYLDDSGSPANPDEDYFVLGGVSVPESSVRWLAYEIQKIALEIDKDNPDAFEFHAAEIFRGTIYPWEQYKSKDDRKKIIKKVLGVLNAANQEVVLFACAIHKNSYPQQDIVIKAYEEISSRFDLYLSRINTDKRNKERGLIVLDRCSYESGLQNLATKIRREGNRWGSYTANICEVPLFIDSRAARIIQLADHIAYATFRRYQADDLTYFKVIEGKFDQKDNVICGLLHKQTYNYNCTCPACITRRDRP
jgi:hypothetical protein